jgi:hypothetical protein
MTFFQMREGTDNLRYTFAGRHLIRRNAGYGSDRKLIVSEPQPPRLPFDEGDSQRQVK